MVRRGDVVFVINHGDDDATLSIDGTEVLGGGAASGLVLPSQGVAIVRRDRGCRQASQPRAERTAPTQA